MKRQTFTKKPLNQILEQRAHIIRDEQFIGNNLDRYVKDALD